MKMRKAEEKLKRPLEEALPPMIRTLGIAGAADHLGVSKATIGFWLLKLGINIKRDATDEIHLV